jgi:hypothetical protein
LRNSFAIEKFVCIQILLFRCSFLRGRGEGKRGGERERGEGRGKREEGRGEREKLLLLSFLRLEVGHQNAR